jgi:hypothetical protein
MFEKTDRLTNSVLNNESLPWNISHKFLETYLCKIPTVMIETWIVSSTLKKSVSPQKRLESYNVFSFHARLCCEFVWRMWSMHAMFDLCQATAEHDRPRQIRQSCTRWRHSHTDGVSLPGVLAASKQCSKQMFDRNIAQGKSRGRPSPAGGHAVEMNTDLTKLSN